MRVLVLLLILSLPHASSFSDSQCHFNNNSRQCERDLVVPVYLKFHKVGSETVTQILHNEWRPYIKRWPSLAFSRDCGNDQFAHQVIAFSFCAPSFVRLVTRVVCRCMRHPLIAAAPCLLAPRPDARVAFLLLLRLRLSFRNCSSPDARRLQGVRVPRVHRCGGRPRFGGGRRVVVRERGAMDDQGATGGSLLPAAPTAPSGRRRCRRGPRAAAVHSCPAPAAATPRAAACRARRLVLGVGGAAAARAHAATAGAAARAKHLTAAAVGLARARLAPRRARRSASGSGRALRERHVRRRAPFSLFSLRVVRVSRGGGTNDA